MTFGQKVPKFNSSLVYCLQLYGTYISLLNQIWLDIQNVLSMSQNAMKKMFKFQIFLVCIIPRVRGLNPDIGSAKFSLTGMGLFMAEIYFAFFRDRLHCVAYF